MNLQVLGACFRCCSDLIPENSVSCQGFKFTETRLTLHLVSLGESLLCLETVVSWALEGSKAMVPLLPVLQ
jgi:hypothetical protein